MTTCRRADAGARFNYTFLTDKERDIETGLDHFEARYYSSIQGRFSSPDPLMASARTPDPRTWNRYAYVLNNPLNLIDQLGLDSDEPQHHWISDGNGNYTSLDDDQYQDYLYDSDNKKYGSQWHEVAVGTNVGHLNYVDGGDAFESANGGLVGSTVTLGADGNFHSVTSSASGEQFGQAFSPYGEPLNDFMERGFVVMTLFTGPVGEAGSLSSLGLESTTEAATFFEGATYSQKVVNQMELGDYHAFPQSVDAFADSGNVRTILGGDGQAYRVLDIPGGYKNAEGSFRYIKDATGVINERRFVPK